MDQNRILELAIEELEKQKAELAAQIEDLRAELKGAGSRAARKVMPVAATAQKQRSKTLAERKALSRKLKAIWAAKKLQKAKAPKPKGRRKTAAEKKALSLKMKAVWAKKRAGAAGKTAKAK